MDQTIGGAFIPCLCLFFATAVLIASEISAQRRQSLWAAAEPPHVVVGNPTSLQRLVDAGKLRLNAVDMVVVDEVDACLIDHHTRQVRYCCVYCLYVVADVCFLGTLPPGAAQSFDPASVQHILHGGRR
jgi:superfamily II DNA/RNA helicase